jgi:hypothetical protein
MVVRADETHLRYSSQGQITASDTFATQGFSLDFRAQSHSRTRNAAGIRALRPPGKISIRRPSFKRLVQTGMRVESDVLFRPKNNEAVAILRQL